MFLQKRLQENNRETESNRVNIGEDDEFLLEGYTQSPWRFIFMAILVMLSGGTLLIFLSWRPALKVRLSQTFCPLDQAQVLVLRNKYGKEYVETVKPSSRGQSFNYKYFCHKKLKYIWNSEYKHFIKLKGLESEKCSVIYSQIEGATSSEASIKQELYGPNSIEIKVAPVWKLIYDEITGPFYLYQFFVCTIWLIQLYYQFALCILFLSIISVSIHVWQTRKQMRALKKKVQSVSTVTVIRDSVAQEKSSTELVPGDVIILPKHMSSIVMDCDAVLMTGTCLVDESMLTGESMPVPKVPLVENPNSAYQASIYKSNTLFSGTKVINVQSAKDELDVKAIVIRTSFLTAKGELARSILFPIQVNNNLKKQLVKISIFFFVLGVPCMIYTVFALLKHNFTTADILIVVLDVSTFLVPPVLPAILTSISVQAQKRLQSKDIYCLNPKMICCSGEVDVMCFDKTGTLTEDSINFYGLVSIENSKFKPMLTDIKSIPFDSLIVKSMASCHSLIEYCGKLEGDDLDLKLFAFTDWTFVKEISMNLVETFGKPPERIVANTSSGDSSQLIGILKQFPFESFLKRMLVIVKDVKQNKLIAIVKGAPETVASFCTTSTIPRDYTNVFESYTSKGFRVLATAYRVLDFDLETCINMSRSEIERDMTLTGLFLFKNNLKPSSFEVIDELMQANIRCVMATGDNLLTAINVAEECKIVNKSDAIIRVRAFTERSTSQLRVFYNYEKYPDFVLVNNNNAQLESGESFNFHLAIDGDSFNAIKLADSHLLDKIVHKGAIFARMSPEQKVALISMLKSQNHSVGMCGDGANDCGALRVADAGISLSVAEASVASPFTYKQKDVSCVPNLLKEGRCTLVAVFGAFKYQVCYCFILLGAVLILFWYGTKPSEGTYVLIDVVMNILPPMLFGSTMPFDKLVKRLPIRNVLSFVPQLSMYSFILIQVFVYWYASFLVTSQPWYEPAILNQQNIHDIMPNHVSSAVISVNLISYVISSIIFAPGPPYRKDFFSNKKYIVVVIINMLIACYVTIIAPSSLLNILALKDLPYEFRIYLMCISLANFIFCFIWEKLLLHEIILNRIIPSLRKTFKIVSNKRFCVIERKIQEENWPFDHLISGRDKKLIDTSNKLINRSKSENIIK